MFERKAGTGLSWCIEEGFKDLAIFRTVFKRNSPGMSFRGRDNCCPVKISVNGISSLNLPRITEQLFRFLPYLGHIKTRGDETTNSEQFWWSSSQSVYEYHRLSLEQVCFEGDGMVIVDPNTSGQSAGQVWCSY